MKRQIKPKTPYKPDPSAYGGDLLKTRSGRSRPRPLHTGHTMHLVLRSTKAVGKQSFTRRHNKQIVLAITDKFSKKHRVKIITMAVVGNHLHFQIKLSKHHSYFCFIRAVTSAIAVKIGGINRWNPKESSRERFWDRRPFTRIAVGLQAFKNLRKYIQINQLEGFGYTKEGARFTHAWNTS